MTDDRDVRRAALEAESRPATIGHALARYREARGWTRDELVDWLGVSPTGLAAIAVEGIPAPGCPMTAGIPFERLADRYGADPGRLREAIG